MHVTITQNDEQNCVTFHRFLAPLTSLATLHVANLDDVHRRPRRGPGAVSVQVVAVADQSYPVRNRRSTLGRRRLVGRDQLELAGLRADLGEHYFGRDQVGHVRRRSVRRFRRCSCRLCIIIFNCRFDFASA